MKSKRIEFIRASEKLRQAWSNFNTDIQIISEEHRCKDFIVPYIYLENLPGGKSEFNQAMYKWYPKDKMPKNVQIHCSCHIDKDKGPGFIIEEFEF